MKLGLLYIWLDFYYNFFFIFERIQNIKRLIFWCVGVFLFWQTDCYYSLFKTKREYYLIICWVAFFFDDCNNLFIFFNFNCLFKSIKEQNFWVIELQGSVDVWDVCLMGGPFCVVFVIFFVFDLRRRDVKLDALQRGCCVVVSCFDTQVWLLYPFNGFTALFGALLDSDEQKRQHFMGILQNIWKVSHDLASTVYTFAMLLFFSKKHTNKMSLKIVRPSLSQTLNDKQRDIKIFVLNS